jgi:3-phenylpropionate/trans-cinnamate dioxygenase ferredoxin component
MSAPIRACALDDLEDGTATTVDVGGRNLALVRVGEVVHAIDDRCSHADVSLGGGEVDPGRCTIECPKHGSEFDLRTGEPLSLPAVRPVGTFRTTVVGGDVMVELT